MAGVKGRSGRKSHYDEKTANEILELAMGTIKSALNDKTLPVQFRAELASKIYTKAMPSVVDATVESTVTEMPALLKDNHRVEPFLIGTPLDGESA